MKTIRKTVSLKTFVTTILMMLAFAGLTFNLGRAGFVGDETEQWYTPSQQATYIVGQYNSSHFYMQNHTGHGYSGYEGYEFLSTNASAVWNNARGNLSTLATGATGTIYVKTGTYQVDSPWIVGKRTHFDCEAAVVLNVTANLGDNHGAIEIDPTNVAATNWRISDVLINMNDFTGNGIYSAWPGNSASQGQTEIDSVYIAQTQYGYWGMNISSPFIMKMSNIRISGSGGGINFPLSLNPYVITGNSVFENVYIGLSHNATIGVMMGPGDGTKFSANLVQWNRLEVYSVGYYNCTGVYISNASSLGYIDFVNFNMETGNAYGEWGAVIENSSSINFWGGLANRGFKINGTSSVIGINGVTFKDYLDETAGTYDILINGGYSWGTITSTTSTTFDKVAGHVTESRGSAVNATATTFSISTGFTTTGGPTFVSCSFNTTAVTGWKWTTTAWTVTITFTGPNNNVTCYYYFWKQN